MLWVVFFIGGLTGFILGFFLRFAIEKAAQQLEALDREIGSGRDGPSCR